MNDLEKLERARGNGEYMDAKVTTVAANAFIEFDYTRTIERN